MSKDILFKTLFIADPSYEVKWIGIMKLQGNYEISKDVLVLFAKVLKSKSRHRILNSLDSSYPGPTENCNDNQNASYTISLNDELTSHNYSI